MWATSATTLKKQKEIDKIKFIIFI
jgi:hypothetical protein